MACVRLRGRVSQSLRAGLGLGAAVQVAEIMEKGLKKENAEAMAERHAQAVDAMQLCARYIGDLYPPGPALAATLLPLYKELLRVRRLAGELMVFTASSVDPKLDHELSVARAKAVGSAAADSAKFDGSMQAARAALATEPMPEPSRGELGLFLGKLEAEYLAFCAGIQQDADVASRAKALFDGNHHAARVLDADSPVRLSQTFSYARRVHRVAARAARRRWR